MKALFALVSFAVAYALGLEMLNYVAIFHFGMWDPKFHDPAGNVAFFHQLLPLLVGIASASFLVGWTFQARRMRQPSTGTVVGASAATGLIASQLIILAALAEKLSSLDVAIVVGQSTFLAGPAMCAVVAFAFVRRRTESPV
jgi:hypothetical protein